MSEQAPFTTGQVAEQLGISSDTLRRHIRSGTVVPSGRSLGGQAHFMPEDVAELRARLQRPASSAQRIAADLHARMEMAKTIADPALRALFVESLSAAIADPEGQLRKAREEFQILAQNALLRLDAEEAAAPVVDPV
jgi:DNA-binding transcriptional MerR regulator